MGTGMERGCYKRSKEVGPKENWLNSNWMFPPEGTDLWQQKYKFTLELFPCELYVHIDIFIYMHEVIAENFNIICAILQNYNTF